MLSKVIIAVGGILFSCLCNAARPSECPSTKDIMSLEIGMQPSIGWYVIEQEFFYLENSMWKLEILPSFSASSEDEANKLVSNYVKQIQEPV